MDYGGILKRSWEIIWRHKILWLFGFFAGAGGGFNFNSNTGDFGRGDSTRYGRAVTEWVQANVALIIAVAIAVFVVAVVMWVLSIAARGGLVYLVAEADEERPVVGGTGWRTGFQYWGRTFLIGFLLALPILVVVTLGAVIAIVAIVGAGAGVGDAGAGVAALFGVCGLLVVVFLVLIPYIIVAGVLNELGIRYGILDDLPAFEAIGRGWADLRRTFGPVAIMWLLALVVSIAFGILIAIVAAVFLVPAVLSFIAGAIVPGVLLTVLAIIVLAVLQAPFSAYHSSLWTLFYRRLHGLGAPGMAQPYAAPQPTYMPPPPPAYPAPGPSAPPGPQPPQPPAPPAEPPAPPQQPE